MNKKTCHPNFNSSFIDGGANKHNGIDYIPSIRDVYIQHGVDEYYQKFGHSYRNPHDSIVQEIVQLACQEWSQNWATTEDLGLIKILDLACGSGEVTLALERAGMTNIQGLDPFTYESYQARTGRIAQRFDFIDISNGVLSGSNYDLIICSFALHLVPISQLPLLLYHLGLVSQYLLVITPHKRPEIKPNWGWLLLQEISWKRVKARLYQSSLCC